jgi:hypothetical protein
MIGFAVQRDTVGLCCFDLHLSSVRRDSIVVRTRTRQQAETVSGRGKHFATIDALYRSLGQITLPTGPGADEDPTESDLGSFLERLLLLTETSQPGGGAKRMELSVGNRSITISVVTAKEINQGPTVSIDQTLRLQTTAQ